MKIVKNHSSHLITENEAEDLYPAIDKLGITMKNEEGNNQARRLFTTKQTKRSL